MLDPPCRNCDQSNVNPIVYGLLYLSLRKDNESSPLFCILEQSLMKGKLRRGYFR